MFGHPIEEIDVSTKVIEFTSADVAIETGKIRVQLSSTWSLRQVQPEPLNFFRGRRHVQKSFTVCLCPVFIEKFGLHTGQNINIRFLSFRSSYCAICFDPRTQPIRCMAIDWRRASWTTGFALLWTPITLKVDVCQHRATLGMIAWARSTQAGVCWLLHPCCWIWNGKFTNVLPLPPNSRVPPNLNNRKTGAVRKARSSVFLFLSLCLFLSFSPSLSIFFCLSAFHFFWFLQH